MRVLFAVLCIILYTQLSWAAPSSLSDTHNKRSHSVLSRVLDGRSSNKTRRAYAGGSYVASSWYASWDSSNLPLSGVSWSKYTSVAYAFATTTPDVHTLGLTQSDQQLLPQFVDYAKQHHVHAILSIGGWGGSKYFSSAVATEESRTAFAQTVMQAVSQYKLDGVEFDWEYPGRQGIGCNIVSKTDTANFLSFLQTLRNQKGAKDLIISAAVSLTPFVGPDGKPLPDVSAFGNVLNYISIMNYDVWGPWSPSVGPNAPLDDSCAPSPQGSAKSAVKAWTSAGFPVHKIILGVPAYGHSYHVQSSNAYDASGKLKPYVHFDKSQQLTEGKWDSIADSADVCDGRIVQVVDGVPNFWELIDDGFLTKDGIVAKGVDYTFDQCSQTPFVYNRKSQVMVSYDNAASFVAKGNYIKSVGLAGFAIWETAGDSHNILLDAISSAVGNKR